MSTERIHISEVLRESMLLRPGGSLSIPFFPSNGRAQFMAFTTSQFGDSYLGAPVLSNDTPGPILPPINVGGGNNVVVDTTSTAPPGVLFMAPRPFDLRPGRLGDIGPVLPPPRDPVPIKEIRIEVFRAGDTNAIVNKEVASRERAFLTIDQLGLVGVGLAPERWVARFTNISRRPLNCNARIFYNKTRTIEITKIPLGLFNKLIHQTVRFESLGLCVKLKGDTFKIDFSPDAKKHYGFREIEVEIPIVTFPDDGVNLVIPSVNVTLDNETRPGRSGLFPHANINFEFETIGDEIDLFGIDLHLSGLSFELDIFFDNHIDPPESTLGPGYHEFIRGDFSRVPYLTAEIDFTTDLRLSSFSLGILRKSINFILGSTDLLVQIITLGQEDIEFRIKTLKEYAEAAVEELATKHASSIASFIQTGIQYITDRDSEFHGLRSGFDCWDVLHRPFDQGFGDIRIPRTIDLGGNNIGPIDSEQPDVEIRNLNRIDHIVVLMLENRSYDHVLGYLSHPSHGNNTAYLGLRGNERNTITNVAPDARPHEMPGTQFFPGPPHGHKSVLRQIANGAMSGFGEEFKKSIIRNRYQTDPRSIMNFHTAGQLANYDRIVAEYGVANNWFCAFPGGTFPNRFCTISGATPILENGELIPDELGYVEIKTIFDFLEEEDISWSYYEHDLSFLRLVDKYRLNTSQIKNFEDFASDALSGLPAVTYIDPNFSDNPAGQANDDHPGGVHTDMKSGQNLIGEIINALQASPDWNNTMLIVTYDEHGGFYDHIAPPGTPPNPFSNVSKVHPKCPNILGVRVPTFVVSPRTPAGIILNRVYDHTSIIKTIVSRFIPTRLGDMSARVQQIAHLGGAVPLTTPRRDFTPFEPIDFEAEGGEVLERGSFHDIISSIVSPARLSDEVIARLKPERDRRGE